MERHYLIAEDDEDTRILIERAYRQIGLFPSHCFVEDGEKVLDYLEGREPYQDRAAFPYPLLLLLDLKMPRMNGLEVLEQLRQSSHRELVVVMFSGSDDENDVIKAYQLGVNSFIHKPVSFMDLQTTLHAIHHYWFGFNYASRGGMTPGRVRSASFPVLPS